MGTDPDPLLDLRGLSLERRTGGGLVRILEGVDLRLDPGQWVAVLGANGSGKSSLLKYLAGEESPLRASVAYMAQDPDDQLVAATVAGEIALGREDPVPRRQLLGDHGLEGLEDLDPRLLSAGQKQRLVLAVATGTGPRVLLCDEPTALQDDNQAEWVLDRLDRWRRDTGGGLITATCDVREARRADHLVLLEEGRVAARGPAAQLLDSDRVRGLLDRSEHRWPAPDRGTQEAGAPVLALRGVGCGFLGPGKGFAGLDLEVGPGQRIGVTGPNGCGKSTLLAVCAGLRAPDAGTVTVAGRTLYRRGRQDLDHGLVMLAPQFPEYMFCRSTVADELGLGPLPAGMDPASFLEQLGLAPDLLPRNPYDLSTGQRRRLALGLLARSGRPLLLADEPTAALDRRGRERIGSLLAAAGSGSALVIASHDRRFLESMDCRILALRPGEMGLAAQEPGC